MLLNQYIKEEYPLITIPTIFKKPEEQKVLMDFTHPLSAFLAVEDLKPDKHTEELLNLLLDGALVIACNMSRGGELVYDVRKLARFMHRRSKTVSRKGQAYQMAKTLLKMDGNELLAEFSTRYMFWLGNSPFYNAPIDMAAVDRQIKRIKEAQANGLFQ
jgi:hypothetical protein